MVAISIRRRRSLVVLRRTFLQGDSSQMEAKSTWQVLGRSDDDSADQALRGKPN
jgi:hypothetical protein